MSCTVLSLIFLLTVYSLQAKSVVGLPDNKDIGLNITTYVPKYGYPLESHTIKTEDGYILTLHRIPFGRGGPKQQENRPPVLLMHGFMCSSIDWLNNGPNNSLGFLLADQGYDVWLGNQRGNMWSRKHVNLNPDLKKLQFFDFSFHEIGIYDLPAKIDYILNKTNYEKLYYVAHSQGTTEFFIMASEKPKYNSKIRLMTALAPVAYMDHLTSALGHFLVLNYHSIRMNLDLAHIHEILRHSDLVSKLAAKSCADGSPTQKLCAAIFYIFGGYDPDELDKSRIPIYASNAPAGASTKQLYHYIQIYKAAAFQQFDYGYFGNLRRYNSFHPPKYQISSITAPVALHHSKNDILCSVTDVERLAKELPHVVLKRIVPFDKFSHLDFQWGIHAKDLVYNEVIKTMSEY